MKRIITGPNAVLLAIQENPSEIQALYVQSGLTSKTATKIFKAAEKNKLTTNSVPRNHIDEIAKDLNHQGVVAIGGSYSYSNLDNLLDLCSKQDSPLLIILDQIQDTGNLGAISRTARCMNATGLIITKDRSAPMTGGAVRSSAGASELIPVARVVNLATALQTIKDSGFTIFGAAADADASVEQIVFPKKTALVLGNEGKGIRRLTKENCSQLFSIPMPGGFESLNVSSAAAIAMYEVARQKLLKIEE